MQGSSTVLFLKDFLGSRRTPVCTASLRPSNTCAVGLPLGVNHNLFFYPPRVDTLVPFSFSLLHKLLQRASFFMCLGELLQECSWAQFLAIGFASDRCIYSFFFNAHLRISLLILHRKEREREK